MTDDKQDDAISRGAGQAFESWWADRVAEGYQYGRGPLGTVRFGFEAGFAAGRAFHFTLKK